MQIAVACFSLEDASGLGLPPVPGGPNDARLAEIDVRSPVAGLYVRAERLLAKLVREAYERAADIEGSVKEDRVAQWNRLRTALAQLSLKGCAEGAAYLLRRHSLLCIVLCE